MAAILGFQDAALLVYRKPHQFMSPAQPIPYFVYLHLLDDIRFSEGEELVGRYESAVNEDALHITLTGTRAVFVSEDDPQLWDVIKRGHGVISGKSPDFPAEVFGEPYAGFELPILAN